MNTQLTPRALDVIADSGETGELHLRNAAPGSSGGGSGEANVLAARIAELSSQHGSLRAAARVLKISPAYLSRLASGEKTAPGDALLRRMGLRVTTTYTRTSCPKAIEPRGCWNVRCQLGKDCIDPDRSAIAAAEAQS